MYNQDTCQRENQPTFLWHYEMNAPRIFCVVLGPHTSLRLTSPGWGPLEFRALAAGLCLATLLLWQQTSRAAEPTDAPAAVVDQSAGGNNWWAFRSPQRHSPPGIHRQDWPRRRSDYFVLAQLEQRRLQPSTEADRRTLYRRLSFDLTGLPPSSADVAQFVADAGPGAYEDLVDRLLASSRYGERMASEWLVWARYGEDQAHETKGQPQDNYPNAFRYRDWVIDAFNSDLPYDEFVRLQLAADLINDGKPENLVALGFLGLGPKYVARGTVDVMADEWAEGVDLISKTFLGLTVACARCHDHKYDPIPTEDYYALAGVLASTQLVNKPEIEVLKVDDELQLKVDPTTIHIVAEAEPQDLAVFLQGESWQRGATVPRGFLSVLGDDKPIRFAEGSGRQELAKAIVDPDNPLTARVIVNRVWGLLLGRYLVATPSNFGLLGSPPTHQELLDDLAVRFIANGWSLKWLVKEVVLSATYRQSSVDERDQRMTDPGNSWYWHMIRKRLPIEMWRDSVLAASAELDLSEVGGPSLELDSPDHNRRTLYSRISRYQMAGLLRLFDYPDPNLHQAQRQESISPLQKLYQMNSRFVLGQAALVTDRVAAAVTTEEGRIEKTYELLFARAPNQRELDFAATFLHANGPMDEEVWQRYTQALLVSNEMLYVD